MKILHALHGFPPEHDGGTEQYVARLVEAQAEAGHQVTVAAGSYSDRWPGFVEQPAPGGRFRLYRTSQKGLWVERWDHSATPFVEAELERLLEREEPDLVHVHHWIRLSRCLVATAAARGVPAVVTAHDLFTTCPRIFRVREDEAFCERPLSVASCLSCVPREGWMSDDVVAAQIERFAAELRRELLLAAAVVVPSQAHARVLARFAALPVDRLTVVPHAALFERQPAAGLAWQPGRPLRLAHWGHLLPFKGPHVLLEAVRALPDPQAVEVVLWGRCEDTGYAARLDGLAQGLRVERRPGFGRDDLGALCADLAVFPSLAHESHSFVLDEAFALGLPALVSQRGAMAERIGAAGAAFPPGDAAALARLVQDILAAPPRLLAMRAALPEPRGFAAHWQELAAVYDAARARRPVPIGRDLDALRGWERLSQALEGRARQIGQWQAAAEEEAQSLRKQAAQAWGKLHEVEARAREQATEAARRDERLAWLEQRAAHLERRASELGRENLLAMPLVLPAKVVLRLWDRLRGKR